MSVCFYIPTFISGHSHHPIYLHASSTMHFPSFSTSLVHQLPLSSSPSRFLFRRHFFQVISQLESQCAGSVHALLFCSWSFRVIFLPPGLGKILYLCHAPLVGHHYRLHSSFSLHLRLAIQHGYPQLNSFSQLTYIILPFRMTTVHIYCPPFDIWMLIQTPSPPITTPSTPTTTYFGRPLCDSPFT